MARTAGGYAGQQAWLGFHDDMFPEDTDGREEWKFLPTIRVAKRTDNWRQAAIGGEMVPNQARKWLGPQLDRTKKMIEAGHFSWVGPYCPALEQQPERGLAAPAAALVRRMGYQFAIEEIRHSASVATGGKLEFALSGENQGVAPFYYRWPVELALLNSEGKVVERLPLGWDVREWLPRKFRAEASLRVTAQPGSYALALGVCDPWTSRPSIGFANELARRDGWTIVSKLEIIKND